VKKKLLFIGITMNCAGTERSFLSLVNNIDKEKYDIDLLLAKREGKFLDLLPKEVNVSEMPECGEMFTLTGKNAPGAIFKCFVKKNPLLIFKVLPYALKMAVIRKKRSIIAMRLWCSFLKYMPEFDASEYDSVISYWGDKTMFYMVDRVKAKNKITWLHFDYSYPERDDELYGKYFSACDKVVTVSHTLCESLAEKFPNISDKCTVIENIVDPKLIRDLALRGDEFPDGHFSGTRILSVGRMTHQKGFDKIAPVLAGLRSEGYNVRWYIVGDGEERDSLINSAMAAGVPDVFLFLGSTDNPYSYMRDCDLFVLPSRYEGKPITVEEAKILYKPIIVTNYLSAEEQLDDGKLGMICGMEPEDIYRAVKTLLDDNERKDAYSRALADKKLGNTEEIQKFYKILE